MRYATINILRFAPLLFVFSCTTTGKQLKMKKSPYVVINDQSQSAQKRSVLNEPAQKVTFPLSAEDQEIVRQLEYNFDNEENCAGLAAPQIGLAKQIIIFAAPDDDDMKKWRPDFTQSMPKALWFNPHYEPLGEDKNEDFEACFSVADLAGPVARFKKIKYRAQLSDGSIIEGIAEGFLARIIQHEIDHINGIIFTKHVEKNKIFSIKEYRARQQERADKQKKDGK